MLKIKGAHRTLNEISPAAKPPMNFNFHLLRCTVNFKHTFSISTKLLQEMIWIKMLFLLLTEERQHLRGKSGLLQLYNSLLVKITFQFNCWVHDGTAKKRQSQIYWEEKTKTNDKTQTIHLTANIRNCLKTNFTHTIFLCHEGFFFRCTYFWNYKK